MNIETYKELPEEIIPDTESLEDTYQEFLNTLKKKLRKIN